MKQDEAIKKLKEIQNESDTECAHMAADDVICDLLDSLGFSDVVDEYNKIKKWYA